MIGQVDKDSRILLEWFTATVLAAASQVRQPLTAESTDNAIGGARRICNEIFLTEDQPLMVRKRT